LQAAGNVSSLLQNASTVLPSLQTSTNSKALTSSASALNHSADFIDRSVDRTCSRAHGGALAAQIVTGGLLSAAVLTSATLLTWLCLLRPSATWLLLTAAILGWLLAALLWAAFGLTLAGGHVVSDACGASADFLAGTESPARASLGRLLPCASLNSSPKSLEQGKEIVSGVVTKYNSMVRSQNGPATWHQSANRSVELPPLPPVAFRSQTRRQRFQKTEL
jgi:hypothetical protein